jgi:hypothetical protein
MPDINKKQLDGKILRKKIRQVALCSLAHRGKFSCLTFDRE